MKNNKDTKAARTPLVEGKSTEKQVRKPLHRQNVYVAKEKPGFRRRSVNYDPVRIQSFLDAGWTIVQGQDQIDDDKPLQSASQMGGVVKKVANRSPDAPVRYQILMEIPEELYQEDQREKQKIVDEREAMYNPRKRSGELYGEGSLS